MLAAAVFTLISCNGNNYYEDRPVEYSKVPIAGQDFVKTHFPDLTVAYVEEERDVRGLNYEVHLSDGTTIDFDKNGEWLEIDCGRNCVPEAIILAAIVQDVKTRYPQSCIVQIDRDRYGFDVELNNGLDLKYDKKGKFIRIDD